ncbi:MAG: DNA repair protein RecO [Chitinophagales bacterium]
MLHKTRGIVCKTLKYSDTSIITHIYTEKLGLQSYIVRGVRSAKSKGKAALYQHGNLLDLVVYHKESASLQNVSEANLAHMYTSTPFDVVKSALLIFYLEVLNKVLQEQEENEGLFDFLFEQFIHLDEMEKVAPNHHIWFLLALSKYLGFYPASGEGVFFDLQGGVFTHSVPGHGAYLPSGIASVLKKSISPELKNYDQLQINTAERKQLLHSLLDYYRLHLHHFSEIKSVQVLESLFQR